MASRVFLKASAKGISVDFAVLYDRGRVSWLEKKKKGTATHGTVCLRLFKFQCC